MSRSGALITLGLFTMLAPFSGLPSSVRSFLALIFGACVVGIGISLRVRKAPAAQEDPVPQAVSSEATIPQGMSAI